MFAVIYRAFVLQECEKEYLRLWKEVVEYFINHCGAKGSTLHKTSEGEFLAYSLWPDQKTRDAVWIEGDTLPTDILKKVQHLKNCLDTTRSMDEIPMEVIERREAS